MDPVKLIADYLVIPTVLVGFGALLMVPKKQRYQTWGRALLIGLVALLFAKLISLLYQGDRPFETLGVEPGAAFLPNPGFPSDHALLVFTVACVVWVATKNVVLSSLLLAAAILVSVGRVMALVHTPLDVIAGGV
ncbi:MAG TPA: phosphatase PAP2 family protein, partial [Magnetospirillaceae bacterium]|nr:phosphatase PAP2 family protein [Magnetospirillaceae bacterium]